MAKTALNQLQDQIDAVRREAFAAGYAAAMQSIREFAAKPAPGAEPGAAPRPRGRPRSATPASSAPPAPSAPPPRQLRVAAKPAQRASRAPVKRPQRGTNARLVEEVLQSNAPRALRPAEIRTAIQRDKGVAMAFTSIRHALGQLEERRTAEQIADSKTWRYRASAASASG
jgi:hypothetical protein